MNGLAQVFLVAQSGRAELDHFRVLYCAWLAVAVLAQLRGHVRFVRFRATARSVARLLNRVPLPHLCAGMFLGLGFGLAASLGVGAIPGSNPVLPLLIAGVGALIYFAQVVEIPAVRRKANTVPIILLLVGAAYLAPAETAERIACACFFTLKLVVAQIYVSSGFTKLRKSGLRWADGESLRMWLVHYHLRNGSRAALALARHHWASRFSAGVVLMFELTFWLMIPFPRLAWVYLPLGIIFHLGTAVLMRIHYWIYLFPAYLMFIPF